MVAELSRILQSQNAICWDYKDRHIACLAHVINLAVKAFLANIKVAPIDELDQWLDDRERPTTTAKGKQPMETTNFSDTVKKLRAISTAINFPRSWTRDFWAFCRAANLKELKAVQDHAVCWNV